MFDFAISNQKPRPPSSRFMLALLVSSLAHLAAGDALIRFPWLLGTGLRNWLIRPVFFTPAPSEEPWRTVAVLRPAGKMLGPSGETLRRLAYDFNLPRKEPPIRIRWGGEDENKQAAVDRPAPAVKPVPGFAEPLPQAPPPAAAGTPSPAEPTPPREGADASRAPVKVYLPLPKPAPEPKESLAKGGDSGQMTSPASIPKTDPTAPSAITQSRTAETKAASPQIFENEQKAIRTEGSGLFDTGGFPLGNYASVIIERVKGNWFIPSNLRNSQGRTTVIFFIARDGRFTDARIVSTSGSSSLDLAALNAIIGSNPFPPLPRGFPGERVGAKFIFAYNERQ